MNTTHTFIYCQVLCVSTVLHLVSRCLSVGVWTRRQVHFCLNVCFPFWRQNQVTLTPCVFQLLPHHWSKHVILFVLSGHPVGHLWLPLTVPWCCCLPGVPRRRIKCSSPLDGCDCALLLLLQLQLLLQHIFIPHVQYWRFIKTMKHIRGKQASVLETETKSYSEQVVKCKTGHLQLLPRVIFKLWHYNMLGYEVIPIGRN